MDVQLEGLADQQFVEAAILAQDKRIVQAGYQQNIVHAEGHQVLEALEEAFGLGCGIGCVSCGGYHLPFLMGLSPLRGSAQFTDRPRLWETEHACMLLTATVASGTILLAPCPSSEGICYRRM